MENVKSNTGHSLSIAAIITAIITFVIAVIPCIGFIAVVPGIVAIVLGIVGLSQSSRNQSARGTAVAGIIIAIIACLISISQIFVIGRILSESGVSNLPFELQNAIKEVKTEILRDLRDENFSIRIEKNGDRVKIDEISIEKMNKRKEWERKLEEYEGVTSSPDSLQKND